MSEQLILELYLNFYKLNQSQGIGNANIDFGKSEREKCLVRVERKHYFYTQIYTKKSVKHNFKIENLNSTNYMNSRGEL